MFGRYGCSQTADSENSLNDSIAVIPPIPEVPLQADSLPSLQPRYGPNTFTHERSSGSADSVTGQSNLPLPFRRINNS